MWEKIRVVFTIPELPDLTTTYFVQLRLDDAAGRTVSSNFYWLSTKPDVPDWEKSTWFYTPSKSFADLRALAGLPAVDLTEVQSQIVESLMCTRD